MRLFSYILLLGLILTSSTFALTADEKRFLKKVEKYYLNLGMREKAAWLRNQVAKGMINSEKMTGEEAGTTARTIMRSGEILINKRVMLDDKYRSIAETAFTLCHERKHSEQSYLGWAGATYNQDAGQGNPYEREGYAEAFVVNRRAAHILQSRMNKAKNAHDRLVIAEQLSEVTRIWRVQADLWKSHKKNFGDFKLGELKELDGSSVDYAAIDREMALIQKRAKDAVVTSKALITSFQGLYRGRLQGERTIGSFNFNVARDYSLRGTIRGKTFMGPFQGTLTGRVNSEGRVTGQLGGTVTTAIGKETFTGDFSGYIKGKKGSGTWKGGAEETWPSGKWSVSR